MEALIKTVRRKVLNLLIAMIMVSSASAYEQGVPADVWKAAREGLRDFYWIAEIDSKVVPKYPDGAIVPNIEESYLGTPYMQLMITDEAILQCADPLDILNTSSEDGYVFPVLNNGSTIAYIAVRFLCVVEHGVNEWTSAGMRLQSEYENKYYELLEAYSPADGYVVFVVSWEHPYDRFFMIQAPGGVLQVYPGSKFIADLLDMSDIQARSNMAADANELLVRLKGMSAEHLATKQRLERETKEWQQQIK
jgi:hypothetical protein